MAVGIKLTIGIVDLGSRFVFKLPVVVHVNEPFVSENVYVYN
jgi:hypothetical protein